MLRAKVDGAPACGITNLNPTSGLVNTPVVIRGTNFTGATTVKFNGQPATFTLNSSSQITASVPGGATTGPISVIAAGGLSTSSSPFSINSPLPPPPVALAIALVGNQLVLSWPTNAAAYALQQNADLTSTNWSAYGGSIITNGAIQSATLTAPGTNLFFRLIAPNP